MADRSTQRTEVAHAIRDTASYIGMALKALMFWRRPPPVATVADLVGYVETRSKFVAQTSLFGYIRTRVGTRYAALMEDDTFVHSVNIAKWEIWLACVCDFAAYGAAQLAAYGATAAEMQALAIHIVDTATDNEAIPTERPQGFDDIKAAFARRAEATDWPAMSRGDAAFQTSMDALVEWAPIADELKVHDVDIVKNSLRGRWKKVRDQLAQILEPQAVLADWRHGATTSARQN